MVIVFIIKLLASFIEKRAPLSSSVAFELRSSDLGIELRSSNFELRTSNVYTYAHTDTRAACSVVSKSSILECQCDSTASKVYCCFRRRNWPAQRPSGFDIHSASPLNEPNEPQSASNESNQIERNLIFLLVGCFCCRALH